MPWSNEALRKLPTHRLAGVAGKTAKVAIYVQPNICYHIYALSNMIRLRTFTVLPAWACGTFTYEARGELSRETLDSWWCWIDAGRR